MIEKILIFIINIPFIISLHISYLIWIICNIPLMIYRKIKTNDSILYHLKNAYEELILKLF